MQNKIKLGETKLESSRLGIGCWGIGGPFKNLGYAGGWDTTNSKEARKGLKQALKMGTNLFDTADVYGLGQSERLLGNTIQQAVKENVAKRKNLIIISKVGYFFGCAPHGYYPLHMEHQLEMTLDNLKTDYIDIYFFHHHNFGKDDKYLESAIKKMREFQSKGLIHHIGLRGPHVFFPKRTEVSREEGKSLKKFLYLAKKIKPSVISIKYNMLDHEIDKLDFDIFDWAKENGKGVLINEPLAHGLLTNKYNPDDPPEFSPQDHRSRKDLFTLEGIKIISSKLSKLGKKFNCNNIRDFAHLALRYCIGRSQSSVVLTGFTKERHVKDNLSTETDNGLTKKERQYINELFGDVNKQLKRVK